MQSRATFRNSTKVTGARARHAARASGFTLIELLVAMAVTLILMAAALTTFKSASDAAYQVSLRAEMQANARVAVNEIVLDLTQAGTNIGLGAPSLPKAPSSPGDPPGGIDPVFGCDPSGCHLPGSGATGLNQFVDGKLYKVTPGYSAGPLVASSPTNAPTDAITIIYVDPGLNAPANPAGWNNSTVTVAQDGSSAAVTDATVIPKLNDPQFGLHVGDVLLIQNANGQAVGDVTRFDGASGTIYFDNADPLQINQTGAPVGSIATTLSTVDPKTGNRVFPSPTTVSRLVMATYYLDDQVAGADGPDSRLMRQLGSQSSVPVAEHIENLQFTYDLFDPNTNTVTAGLQAPASPSEIRKINIQITARSPARNRRGNYDRITFNTSVGPSNLSLHQPFTQPGP